MNGLLNYLLIAVCVVLLARWIYQGTRLYLLYRSRHRKPEFTEHSSQFHQKNRKIIWLAPITKMMDTGKSLSIQQDRHAELHSRSIQVRHQNREQADLLRK